MNSKYMLQAIPVTPETRDRQQTASYPVDDLVMQVGEGAAMTVGQVAALRWGVDSTEKFDSLEWERRMKRLSSNI